MALLPTVTRGKKKSPFFRCTRRHNQWVERHKRHNLLVMWFSISTKTNWCLVDSIFLIKYNYRYPYKIVHIQLSRTMYKTSHPMHLEYLWMDGLGALPFSTSFWLFLLSWRSAEPPDRQRLWAETRCLASPGRHHETRQGFNRC